QRQTQLSTPSSIPFLYPTGTDQQETGSNHSPPLTRDPPVALELMTLPTAPTPSTSSSLLGTAPRKKLVGAFNLFPLPKWNIKDQDCDDDLKFLFMAVDIPQSASIFSSDIIFSSPSRTQTIIPNRNAKKTSISSLSPNKQHTPVLTVKMIEKRLNHLRQELVLLQNGKHTKYTKRLTKLLQAHEKQVDNLQYWRHIRHTMIDSTCNSELRQTNLDFDEKKLEVKSKLLTSYHDRRRIVEYEHLHLDIRDDNLFEYDIGDQNGTTGLHGECQQRISYNLRRQQQPEQLIAPPFTSSPNEGSLVLYPPPLPESVRPTSMTLITTRGNLLPLLPTKILSIEQKYGDKFSTILNLNDIDCDIKKIRPLLTAQCPSPSSSAPECSLPTQNGRLSNVNISNSPNVPDMKIEDGRLWYNRQWFSRGNPILILFNDDEAEEIITGVILSIGRNDLLIRRSGTNVKHRISIHQLYDGQLKIKKRR
ncbi:unnamed protein product, partial [Didymodactylos carnosus]